MPVSCESEASRPNKLSIVEAADRAIDELPEHFSGHRTDDSYTTALSVAERLGWLKNICGQKEVRWQEIRNRAVRVVKNVNDSQLTHILDELRAEGKFDPGSYESHSNVVVRLIARVLLLMQGDATLVGRTTTL